MRQNLSDLKQNYIKIKSELSVARRANNKVKGHIASLGCQCWSNSQYSRREWLEISVIPDKTDQKDLEDTVLHIFKKLHVEIESSDIKDCHWLPSMGPKRVIINFSKQKNSNKICHCRKNLKRMDLTLFGIFSPVFINDSPCQYYKNMQKTIG